MRLFFHLVRLSFQQQLTYRTAILAGLATNFFFALLRVSVLIALYNGKAEVNGLSIQGAITYVAISQAMLVFLMIFGWWDLIATIYDGSIGSDLLRPMPLFSFWMARELGRSLVNLIGRGILLFALFSLLYSVIFPQSWEQWLGLLLAMSLGWLVSYAWRFLVNLTAFWTPDARGIGRIAFTFSQLFSGFMMPLRLYPDWFVRVCHLTPFPALFNTSAEVYLGLLKGPEIWPALLNQLVWFIILALCCRLVLKAGVRRLVVQGG